MSDDKEIMRLLAELDGYIGVAATKMRRKYLSSQHDARDDLVQAARLAVVQAVKNRDPHFSDAQFHSYVRTKIWGGIVDEIRTQHWGSRYTPAVRMAIEVPELASKETSEALMIYKEDRDWMLSQIDSLIKNPRNRRILRAYLAGRQMIDICKKERVSNEVGYNVIRTFKRKAVFRRKHTK